jgi:hypothetical protein
MVLYLSVVKKPIGQVMKFIQHIFSILVPSAALALTGCSNGEYVLGGQYLDSHMHTVIIDTCTVKLSTVVLDSLNTTNLGKGLVGRFTDDRYFGEIKATTYITYSNPGSHVFEDYDVYFDSCALVMTLNGSYIGDTLKTQDIDVHLLKEALVIPDKNKFWSNETREYNPTPFVTYKLHPRPNTPFKAERPFPYYNYTNHFYLRLPDTLGIGLFNRLLDADDNAIIKDDIKWRAYFPGIAVTAGNNNNGVYGFKMSQDSLFVIRLFYHYAQESRKKGTIDILPDAERNFYGVECDRKSGLPFSDLHVGTSGPLVGKREIDTKNSNNVALVQAFTSTYVKIEFPYLNKLLELGDFCAITDAALLLYPARESYSDTMPLPGNLSLFISDEHDATLAQVTSSTGTALTGNLYKDEFKKNTYYSYDISTFLNGQLGKTGMYKRYLQLTPPKDTIGDCVNTMILGDQKYTSDGTRVIVKYLIYENE